MQAEEKKEKAKKEKKVKEPAAPPPPAVHKKDFEKEVVYLYQFPRCPTLPNISPKCLQLETWLKLHGIKYEVGGRNLIFLTRELPGVALVNISTRQIFMGKGNILNYIDILK